MGNAGNDTRTSWSAPMFEWAFRVLPEYLEKADLQALEEHRLVWQQRTLEALETDPRRVHVLVSIAREDWVEDLRERVERLSDRLLADLKPDEARELGEYALTSGHLKAVEQEDLPVEVRSRELLQERKRVLKVRGLIDEAMEQAPADDEEARTVMKRLHRRLGSLARKLHNYSDEALLALRLEKLFGRRPVAWFSRFTFLCLVALLVLLVVDMFLPRGTAWDRWFPWVDTGICFVFLWEFLVRFTFARRRGSWFLRHFITDFVPALPFAMPIGGVKPSEAEAAGEFWLRMLRLLRIPIYARYLRLLRPFVAFFRIIVFWVRGMDRIVLGMAPLLNREIILFEPEDQVREPRRVFQAEGAEHNVTQAFVRLSPDLRKESAPRLVKTLGHQLALVGPEVFTSVEVEAQMEEDMAVRRVRAEDLIETLENLTAEEVAQSLPEETVSSLGRLLAMTDIPPLRWFPIVGRIVQASKGATGADRVAQAGRAIAGYCNVALGFVKGWADIAGVLTAPQILDRIATAMVKGTQRPAVRLLLFGGLFVLIKLLFEAVFFGEHFEDWWFGRVLDKYLATPLLVLGTLCLIGLALAKWMKRVAGQANDQLLRLAEARYVNLMELSRRRKEPGDLRELVARVCPEDGVSPDELEAEVENAMEELRSQQASLARVSRRARSVGLLLLDAQDGAFLHRTNTKGAEQFLSHPDLWSLRHEHAGTTKRQQRRLAKLDLETGGFLSGCYLWFDMLTHALSVKVARLTSTYNLHLLPKSERALADKDAIERHNKLVEGSSAMRAQPGGGVGYRTSYFHVLHFLSDNPVWEREIERDFGIAVFARLAEDRRKLVRELFGTRALHRLPVEQRSFNPLDFYQGRVGGGRVLLLPFKLFVGWLKLTWILFRLAARSLRDILDPRIKPSDVVDTRASFSVARRKLRRMKKPLLYEAVLLLSRVDPHYIGLLESGADREGRARVWDDLELVLPTPIEELRIHRVRERAAKRMLYLPKFLATWTEAPAPDTPQRRRLAAAFALDERRIASLAAAEERARAWLMAANKHRKAPSGALPPPDVAVTSRGVRRGFGRMVEYLGTTSRRERRYLRRALRAREGDLSLVCQAFFEAGDELPTAAAWRHAHDLSVGAHAFLDRQATLRAIVGLLVLDLQHHEDLVYELGCYREDEEQRRQAPAEVAEPVEASGT